MNTARQILDASEAEAVRPVTVPLTALAAIDVAEMLISAIGTGMFLAAVYMIAVLLVAP